MWKDQSCLLIKIVKNTEEINSYLESHSAEEIARDYVEFLQTILLGEKLTDRDFFVEECFWSDKIGVDALPPDLEQKRLEALRLAEQMYAETLLGDFISMSSTDIAHQIVDWTTKKNLSRLTEEEIELFWKERFGIDISLQPQNKFEKTLQAKFLQAGEIASRIIGASPDKSQQ